MAALLTEERPVRLDPEYQAALEAVIKKYKGEQRKKVKAAIVTFIQARDEGTFGELVAKAEVVAKEAAGG